MKRGFILLETLLSLGIAMSVVVMMLPAFSNLLLSEKRVTQERSALMVCRTQVRLAETEPLESLQQSNGFRVTVVGGRTGVEILNPVIKNLVVLR